MSERDAMRFPTKVQGIPCLCEITSHSPYVPAKTWGPPENCYPEEGGEIEFELLDRNGRYAQWLHNKLTPEIQARIEEEASLWIQGQQQEPAFEDY